MTAGTKLQGDIVLLEKESRKVGFAVAHNRLIKELSRIQKQCAGLSAAEALIEVCNFSTREMRLCNAGVMTELNNGTE